MQVEEQTDKQAGIVDAAEAVMKRISLTQPPQGLTGCKLNMAHY